MLLAICGLLLTGCELFGPAPDAMIAPCPPAGTPAQIWCEPPYVEHHGPIYVEPGAAPGVMVSPPVMIQQPLVAPGPASGVTQQPSWWDVLPEGGGAISPDFGLPRGPVVENRLPNPIVVPVANNELAWDQLADVVTNYFPIQSEQPVQQVGGMLTEGYIETPYQVGATVLEPHRNDSVGEFNRWQSTLQSIRRKALINVQPTAGGYAIRVQVAKQLEDLPRPERAPAGAAVLLTDGSLPTKRQADASLTQYSNSWIDLGRDEPLEQEMLRRIRDRLAGPATPASPPLLW